MLGELLEVPVLEAIEPLRLKLAFRASADLLSEVLCVSGRCVGGD